MASSFNVKDNTFYKAKEMDADTSLRIYYPDSFDGLSNNGELRNDANEKFYIANISLEFYD